MAEPGKDLRIMRIWSPEAFRRRLLQHFHKGLRNCGHLINGEALRHLKGYASLGGGCWLLTLNSSPSGGPRVPGAGATALDEKWILLSCEC